MIPRRLGTHVWSSSLVLGGLAVLAHAETPRHAVLPEPFHEVEPASLIQMVYPTYVAETGVLDPSAPGWGAEVRDAKALEVGGDSMLVVLIGSFGLEEDGAKSFYGLSDMDYIDLALFSKQQERVTLNARLKEASHHDGHGWAGLESVPELGVGVLTVGIWVSYSHMGTTHRTLTLYERTGRTFRQVFERIEYDANPGMHEDRLEGDLDAEQMKAAYSLQTTFLATEVEAKLRAEASGSAYHDLVVTETTRERDRDGKLRRRVIEEVWRYDAGRREYLKLR